MSIPQRPNVHGGNQKTRLTGVPITVQAITERPENTVQKHRNTETQEYRNTGIQKHRNTETQEHRNTETQKHRDALTWHYTAAREDSGK